MNITIVAINQRMNNKSSLKKSLLIRRDDIVRGNLHKMDKNICC